MMIIYQRRMRRHRNEEPLTWWYRTGHQLHWTAVCNALSSVVVWSCPLELHRNMFIQHNEGQTGMGANEPCAASLWNDCFLRAQPGHHRLHPSVESCSHYYCRCLCGFSQIMPFSSCLGLSFLDLSCPFPGCPRQSTRWPACSVECKWSPGMPRTSEAGGRWQQKHTDWLLVVLVVDVDCFSMANGN